MDVLKRAVRGCVYGGLDAALEEIPFGTVVKAFIDDVLERFEAEAANDDAAKSILKRWERLQTTVATWRRVPGDASNSEALSQLVASLGAMHERLVKWLGKPRHKKLWSAKQYRKLFEELERQLDRVVVDMTNRGVAGITGALANLNTVTAEMKQEGIVNVTALEDAVKGGMDEIVKTQVDIKKTIKQTAMDEENKLDLIVEKQAQQLDTDLDRRFENLRECVTASKMVGEASFLSELGTLKASLRDSASKEHQIEVLERLGQLEEEIQRLWRAECIRRSPELTAFKQSLEVLLVFVRHGFPIAIMDENCHPMDFSQRDGILKDIYTAYDYFYQVRYRMSNGLAASGEELFSQLAGDVNDFKSIIETAGKEDRLPRAQQSMKTIQENFLRNYDAFCRALFEELKI